VIRWEHREDGIVVLTLDDPVQGTNTMNARYTAAMLSTMERLESERASITGVVVTSAKDGFLAGADLKDLTFAVSATHNGEAAGTEAVAAGAFRVVEEMKGLLRRLERLGHGSGRAYALGIGSAAWLLAAGGGVG